MTAPLKVWIEAEDRMLRMRLSPPPKNLIDATIIAAFGAPFAKQRINDHLGAVLVVAGGPHVSFGVAAAGMFVQAVSDRGIQTIKKICSAQVRDVTCEYPLHRT